MENIEETQVQCDEEGCGWSTEVEWEAVPKWHNEPCPDCSCGVIVNDADMAAYYAMDALAKLSDAIDPNRELPRETITMDTRPLRSR